MPKFVSSDLNYCRHVHVQSKFYLVWMLLVVNIVICPIGTVCGGSAPVVGLYRRFALTATGNYCTRVAKHVIVSAILNVT